MDQAVISSSKIRHLECSYSLTWLNIVLEESVCGQLPGSSCEVRADCFVVNREFRQRDCAKEIVATSLVNAIFGIAERHHCRWPRIPIRSLAQSAIRYNRIST